MRTLAYEHGIDVLALLRIVSRHPAWLLIALPLPYDEEYLSSLNAAVGFHVLRHDVPHLR